MLLCTLLSLLSFSHACPKECSCKAKVVDCRGRGLYDIPHPLHSDTQELYLQDNRIRGLGSMAFREIPIVRVLDLSNNSITSVSPTALLGLRNLQRLGLAHNNLRELDKRLFGPIRTLSHLDLSHNRSVHNTGASYSALCPCGHFIVYSLLCRFLQLVGTLWSYGRQSEESQPSGPGTQQNNTSGPLPAGGSEPPGQHHATRQPVEM